MAVFSFVGLPSTRAKDCCMLTVSHMKQTLNLSKEKKAGKKKFSML